MGAELPGVGRWGIGLNDCSTVWRRFCGTVGLSALSGNRGRVTRYICLFISWTPDGRHMVISCWLCGYLWQARVDLAAQGLVDGVTDGTNPPGSQREIPPT